MSGSQYIKQCLTNYMHLKNYIFEEFNHCPIEIIHIIFNFIPNYIPITSTPFICDIKGNYKVLNDLYHNHISKNAIIVMASDVDLDFNHFKLSFHCSKDKKVGIHVENSHNVILSNVVIEYANVAVKI